MTYFYRLVFCHFWRLCFSHHHLNNMLHIQEQTRALFYALPLVGLQEEDILDLLEQCELDDEKLTGKSARQRGPKVSEN